MKMTIFGAIGGVRSSGEKRHKKYVKVEKSFKKSMLTCTYVTYNMYNHHLGCEAEKLFK